MSCTERNGQIIGYNISYFPSRYNNYKKSDNIMGTSEMERRYTATQLTPLTQYIFMVTAVSSYNGRSFSDPARIIYWTNRTSGKSSTVVQQHSLIHNKYFILDVIFFLNGTIYTNNTIIDVNDIGSTNYEALLCLTNASNCCSNNQGEWYFPNEVSIDDSTSNSMHLSRGPSVVRLNLIVKDGLFPVGVYRCEIPDANRNSKNIYIGIYPSNSGVGMPMMNNIPEYSIDNNSQILTCTSTGGPATTVEWWKDDQILGDDYEQHKWIINQTTAEYQSTLSLNQSRPEEVIGNYTCRVSNARGGDTKAIRLHGKS
jgi:hypothetical protein